MKNVVTRVVIHVMLDLVVMPLNRLLITLVRIERSQRNV